jgi:hypothetical protein
MSPPLTIAYPRRDVGDIVQLWAALTETRYRPAPGEVGTTERHRVVISNENRANVASPVPDRRVARLFLLVSSSEPSAHQRPNRLPGAK